MPIPKKTFILFIVLIGIASPTMPQFFHKNNGISTSYGGVGNGSVKNPWLLPVRGDNYKSFSWFSYYLLGRAYVNQNVYFTVVGTYKALNEELPDICFRYMECSDRNGGKMFPHHTHQNGLSIDFMTPLKKNNSPFSRYDRLGVFRYLMNFDKHGKAKLNQKVEVDFEIIAQHILMLQEIGKKYHIRISKVILNLELKDKLFNTSYGPQLKQSGIYFPKNLTPQLNRLHDDHYHVDFEFVTD